MRELSQLHSMSKNLPQLDNDVLGLSDVARHRLQFQPRRVAMISMHTSPLAQAGAGDAGGMNIYVLNIARELAYQGIQVEIFTRAVSSQDPAAREICDGVLVRNILAGPFGSLPKHELPAQLCAFSLGVLRVGAARPPQFYDVIHSHYWLSGQVGFLAKDRWSIPLVHTAHTLAAVKNRHLAQDDTPETDYRIQGEQQVISEADRLIVNTAYERQELLEEYQVNSQIIDIISPGVETRVFYPASTQQARAELGFDQNEFIIGFVGRIQPLKGFDTLVRALNYAKSRINLVDTPYTAITLAIVGGISGNVYSEDRIRQQLVECDLIEQVKFFPAMPQSRLAQLYRACNIIAMPSHSESFGLVALEAQAAGTPVIATRVGGLPIAINEDKSGCLISGHNSAQWGEEIIRLIKSPEILRQMSTAAVEHAKRFAWSRTADLLLGSYRQAIYDYRQAQWRNLA